MKKPIILYLLLLPFSIFSQELNFEELKERLKSESDREKIETYLDISEIGLPMDSNLHYLNLALETAEKIHFDSIFAIESAISMSYYMGGDYESAKSSIRKSLDHIQYTTYTRARIGHVHMLLGAYCEALKPCRYL
ncbi:MAG: hypothetical protein MI810_19690 [Flavobacteriales bacterium]|nr:hypothetical protein [Flavobacteriales bacterium]